jgi:hypothetical protein
MSDGYDIHQLDKRLSMVERDSERHEKETKELMRRVVAGEARVEASMSIVTEKLVTVTSELSHIKGSADALKWVIPLVVSVILAGVGVIVKLTGA